MQEEHDEEGEEVEEEDEAEKEEDPNIPSEECNAAGASEVEKIRIAVFEPTSAAS